jgi:hypothetical protein
MTLSTIMGTGGHALLLTAIILRLARGLNLTGTARYAIVALALSLVLLPLGQLSAAQFTRGLFGDLSITGIILLGRFLLLPGAPRQESRQLFILVLVAGALFYPAALGMGMTDPYQWGYLNGLRGIGSPLLFLGSLLMLMAVAWHLGNRLIMLCITLALAGFMLRALESNNIWDYLIDPMLFIYCLFSLGLYLITQLYGHYRANRDHPA